MDASEAPRARLLPRGPLPRGPLPASAPDTGPGGARDVDPGEDRDWDPYQSWLDREVAAGGDPDERLEVFVPEDGEPEPEPPDDDDLPGLGLPGEGDFPGVGLPGDGDFAGPGVPWFGDGQGADQLAPGPFLGVLTGQAAEGAAAGGLSGREVIGALRASFRLSAREQYKQVLLAAAYGRQQRAVNEAALARGVPAGCAPGGFPGDELAVELAITRSEAGHLIDDAIDLTARLPVTLVGSATTLRGRGAGLRRGGNQDRRPVTVEEDSVAQRLGKPDGDLVPLVGGDDRTAAGPKLGRGAGARSAVGGRLRLPPTCHGIARLQRADTGGVGAGARRDEEARGQGAAIGRDRGPAAVPAAQLPAGRTPDIAVRVEDHHGCVLVPVPVPDLHLPDGQELGARSVSNRAVRPGVAATRGSGGPW